MAADVDFTIAEETIDPRTHVIVLGGEVDLYTAPEFKERLLAAIADGKTRIVIDLTGVTFLDSTTLGVLVGGIKRLRPVDGAIVLACADPRILKIFEITGLDSVFGIHPDRAVALAAL